MAFTLWEFRLTVWFSETSTAQVTRTYEMQAADYATALADAATVIAAIEAITTAEIAGFGVTGRYYEDDFTDPPEGTYNANTAVLLLDPTNAASIYPTVSIPAPKEAIFTAESGPGNNIVDITDEDVLAVVALFAVDAELYISDGETADGLLSGERVHTRQGAL